MNFMSYVFVENGTSHSHDGKKSYIGLHEVNLYEVLVGKLYRKDTRINIDIKPPRVLVWELLSRYKLAEFILQIMQKLHIY